MANGEAVRFCQQCAVLQPVLGERQGAATLGAIERQPRGQPASCFIRCAAAEFHKRRRSCRQGLERHNELRKERVRFHVRPLRGSVGCLGHGTRLDFGAVQEADKAAGNNAAPGDSSSLHAPRKRARARWMSSAPGGLAGSTAPGVGSAAGAVSITRPLADSPALASSAAPGALLPPAVPPAEPLGLLAPGARNASATGCTTPLRLALRTITPTLKSCITACRAAGLGGTRDTRHASWKWRACADFTLCQPLTFAALLSTGPLGLDTCPARQPDTFADLLGGAPAAGSKPPAVSAGGGVQSARQSGNLPAEQGALPGGRAAAVLGCARPVELSPAVQRAIDAAVCARCTCAWCQLYIQLLKLQPVMQYSRRWASQ